MHSKMAESGRGEADGDNEISDPPASDKDSLHTKSLNTDDKQMESPVKEKPGFMKSFRASLKMEKSPFTSNKRSKNTSNDPNQTSDSPLRPPSSPSLKRTQSLQFQSQKPSLTRTMSEALSLPEERRPKVMDRVKEEVGDTYSLPEIPSVPLSGYLRSYFLNVDDKFKFYTTAVGTSYKRCTIYSSRTCDIVDVMEINKLIEREVLEEAYVNLLSLRLELQHERQALDKEDCPIELVHKEKDLHLLYGTLRDKMSNIVRSSSALPSRNKEVLVYVAHIILEEENRQGEPGGVPGWREGWRDAIRDGVRDTLKKVHRDNPEQKTSWLAVHLGLLGKAVVEDLERVKAELLSSYPPNFDVFETYVSCHHEVVGEHLKSLLEQVTELKDYYALLDFIIHRYPSEKIMGSSSLQPEMKADWKALPLDKDFLNQIKSKYCDRLQTDMKTSLDRIIELEVEEMWNNRRKPTIDEGLYSSQIDMDIWTKIKGHVQVSRRIDVNLEQKVVRSCLEELKLFPKRFESAFVEWSSTLSNSSPWAEYHICYINSFSGLKEHMECYKESCLIPLEQVQKEMNALTSSLSQTLMGQFKTDVQPFLRRQMTRKWFSFDDDFSQLISRTKCLSAQIKYMRPTHKQTFVNEAHFFVVREYISQLMKNNYSCKNRKNETAASKITSQWAELKELFQDMNTTLDWLHPVGNHLSKIIGCKKSDIKNNLQPLVDNYPDIRRSHLSAVLYFRGVIRGREKHSVLQHLTELKESSGNMGNKEHVLFSEIQAAENTDCLAVVPFTCLSFVLPDS